MTPSKNHIDASSQEDLDSHYMKLALKQAKRGEKKGEVPVGAIVVDSLGNILAKCSNLREQKATTLGHAELVAIHRSCKKLKSWRLVDCTLYVTLEPCFMCAGALVQSRVKRVVFGASDAKAGALVSLASLGSDSRLNHRFAVTGGVLEQECSKLLKDFFKKKRKK